MSYRVKKRESVQQAVRRIAAEQGEKALEELDGDDIDEAVHSARVRVKRVRAALRLARGGMDKGDFRDADALWRDAGRAMQPARDAIVRRETVTRLQETIDAMAAEALNVLLANLPGADEDGARAAVHEARGALERALKRTAKLKVEDDLDVLREGLKLSYREGQDRGGIAFASGAPEDFHRWRKRVKALAMQARILRRSAPHAFEALHAQAGELAELLGEEHDLTELRAFVLAQPDLAGGAGQAALLAQALTERSVHLRARARPLFEALYAEKPGAFAKRLEAGKAPAA